MLEREKPNKKDNKTKVSVFLISISSTEYEYLFHDRVF
jgi:hypothetical protein